MAPVHDVVIWIYLLALANRIPMNFSDGIIISTPFLQFKEWDIPTGYVCIQMPVVSVKVLAIHQFQERVWNVYGILLVLSCGLICLPYI